MWGSLEFKEALTKYAENLELHIKYGLKALENKGGLPEEVALPRASTSTSQQEVETSIDYELC